LDSTALILGIIGLGAVWLWSNAKVQAAAINSSLLTPQGLNALGNVVGASSNGLANVLSAITYSPTGSNTGGGPLAGQYGGPVQPGDTSFGGFNSNLLGIPSLTDPTTGMTAGGPDGGDTGAPFGSGFTSSDLGIPPLNDGSGTGN
jgi:hypothetical protein